MSLFSDRSSPMNWWARKGRRSLVELDSDRILESLRRRCDYVAAGAGIGDLQASARSRTGWEPILLPRRLA